MWQAHPADQTTGLRHLDGLRRVRPPHVFLDWRLMTHRAKLLGQARADLTQLPAMLDELARCLTERGAAGAGKPSKVSGSPAPLRLGILHLTDDRRKPGWETVDPEYTMVFDRLGISPGLEVWVKKLTFALLPDFPDLTEHRSIRSEAATLIEYWDFICEQDWAETMADQISDVTGQVKAALRIPREQRFACIQCGNPAYLQFGDNFLICNEGHEVSVRNLEEQQRRRPALPIDDITAEFGITKERIYSWHKRKQIKPMEGSKPLTWFPWDVILLTNPALADAIKAREAMSA